METAPSKSSDAAITDNNQIDETLSEFRETHKDDRVKQMGQYDNRLKLEQPLQIQQQHRKNSWWPWGDLNPVVPTESTTETELNGTEHEQDEVDQEEPTTPLEQSISPNTATAPINNTHEERRESWVEWINPVPRVNSVVSYIYTPLQVNPQPQEQNGILPNQLSSIVNSRELETHSRAISVTSSRGTSHLQQEQTAISWFPWTYFQPRNGNQNDTSERQDSMYSSKDSEEIARDAKKAIQSNSTENLNSSWAFWSNKRNPNGELAVSGTGSEFHPARMSTPPVTYYENQEQALKPPAQPVEVKKSLVLPKFEQYCRNSTLSNRTRIFLSSSKLLKQTFNIKPQTHLYRSEKPKVIKKAVVIGIHGFFPIRMVRTLIGHPTGTSMKFASKATEVLTKWASDNKVDMDIETIALEGEGKIVERVENLINLLENWIEMITICDFIYVASHSQGVMVAIHLISEMILRKMISTRRTKIGMLNMCGVCNGPIVGLDSKLIVKLYSKFENEILMELFDFQDLTSYQSIKLLQSVRTLVANNVKVTFVGSINDQLSPLYSSLFTIVNHPNISRGLFVDKNTNEEIPEFLIKLVEDCIIAQNVGYSDCDLLFELSKYSSGSLTNGGHSKVYNEDEVYLLGIRNALETDSLVWRIPSTLKVADRQFNAKNINKNPYHLPWCLRGFIDSLVCIKNLDGQKLREELLNSCASWNPQSKIHKELKYSVEVICQKY